MTDRIHKTLTGVENLKAYSLALGLLICWFITHPYLGIRNDGLLYAVQALSHLYPKAFENDIFIRYGLQDNYTIFSRIYAFSISWLGLSKATSVLMLIGYILWLSASFFMARILLKGKSIWFFLVLLFTFPGNYGSEGIFSYGESFLTPRIFAEALTIYSVAFCIKERLFLSVAFLFFSLLFHPLIAGCGCIYLLIYRQKIELKKITIKLLIVISAMLIFASIGIAPFSDLFRVMDDKWYELVHLRNSFVFIGTWNIKAINLVMFDSSIILSSTIISDKQQRNVQLSILFISIVGLLVSWIGADILHNLFIIKVQLWRAFWLTCWTSYLAMALLIAKWKSNTNISRILLFNYISAWFLLDHIGGILSLIILIFFYYFNKRKEDFIISKTVRTFAYLLPAVIGIFWLIMETQSYKLSLNTEINYFSLNFVVLLLLRFKLMFAIVFLFFGKLMEKIVNKSSIIMTIFLLIMLFSEILIGWSFRPQFSLNKKYMNEETFKNKIPIDFTVYWPDSIEKTWLSLNRSSYASYRQGSAILFSRKLAMMWAERLKRLSALGVKDSIISSKEHSLINYTPGLPTLKGLIYVCNDPKLDFVVLSSKFSEGLIGEDYDNGENKFYYLYDCSNIRKNLQNQVKNNKLE